MSFGDYVRQWQDSWHDWALNNQYYWQTHTVWDWLSSHGISAGFFFLACGFIGLMVLGNLGK